MNENDVALLKRMATDLATVASAVQTLTFTMPPLAARVAALEATHGTNVSADTTEISKILSTIDGAVPAVAQAADSSAQTANMVTGAGAGSASGSGTSAQSSGAGD
ncbi:hypothetical protein ACRAWG_31435 [Methylobacterium sp. P31]